MPAFTTTANERPAEATTLGGLNSSAVAVGAESGGASELAILFEAAGVARHLEAWPEANAGARERARASLSPDAYALLLREVQVALAAPRLLEEVAAPLSASLAAGAIRSLRGGYTGNGANTLLGHSSGISAATLRDFPGFASEVSRRQIAPARFRFVARLDEATGFGRNAWRVTTARGGAIARGARALRCEPAAWHAPLPPEVAAEREKIAEPFRERVHLELLFLTRNLETADLRRAVRFLETVPARAFHEKLGQALDRALDAAFSALRERLAPSVADRCG